MINQFDGWNIYDKRERRRRWLPCRCTMIPRMLMMNKIFGNEKSILWMKYLWALLKLPTMMMMIARMLMINKRSYLKNISFRGWETCEKKTLIRSWLWWLIASWMPMKKTSCGWKICFHGWKLGKCENLSSTVIRKDADGDEKFCFVVWKKLNG